MSIEDLEERIECLEEELEDAERQIKSLEEDVSILEEEKKSLEEEIEELNQKDDDNEDGLDTFYLDKEMLFDWIKENWDRLKLEDLKAIYP